MILKILLAANIVHTKDNETAWKHSQDKTILIHYYQ